MLNLEVVVAHFRLLSWDSNVHHEALPLELSCSVII